VRSIAVALRRYMCCHRHTHERSRYKTASVRFRLAVKRVIELPAIRLQWHRTGTYLNLVKHVKKVEGVQHKDPRLPRSGTPKARPSPNLHDSAAAAAAAGLLFEGSATARRRHGSNNVGA
jgi:hypothetical protein